jgi:hypothetical protein
MFVIYNDSRYQIFIYNVKGPRSQSTCTDFSSVHFYMMCAGTQENRLLRHLNLAHAEMTSNGQEYIWLCQGDHTIVPHIATTNNRG